MTGMAGLIAVPVAIESRPGAEADKSPASIIVAGLWFHVDRCRAFLTGGLRRAEQILLDPGGRMTRLSGGLFLVLSHIWITSADRIRR